MFSVFLRFRGGKGVATALGVLAGINAWVALSALLVWLAVAILTRYSSAAALSAAVITPISGAVLLGATPTVAVLALIAGILVWRHAPNIRKLMNGSESKIGASKS